ncbi:MAG: hypothetical protein II855_03660 [Candidatus Methanomethylophilaceae archaeon]|nr:hypothetical protein [Candidatus Methanomethylophilaceae archaeon]
MDRKMLAVGAVIVAVILLGQCLAYYGNSKCTSISTETDGSEVSYTVKTDSDFVCDEAHLKNGFDAPRTFYILTDPSYGSAMSEEDLKSTCYLMSREIGLCSSLTLESADAGKISHMIDASLSSGKYDIGLAIVTGAIPDVLYDGTSSCKIMQWVSAGGTLYYSGSQFGINIATHEGVKQVDDWSAVSTDLFGTDQMFCLDPAVEYAKEIVNPELTDLAKLTFNGINYGIRMSAAPAESLFLGYTDGTYASVSLMKYGNGQLVHFGSTTGYQNSYALAHVMSLGLTYKTELVSDTTCNITGSSHGGEFEDSADLTHVIILSDLRVARIWVYDRVQSKFV